MTRVRRVLGILLACWSVAAAAQLAPPGPVRLQAPNEVGALLRKHLTVLRERPEVLDAAERARIARVAREEITELLATQGYFSPKIDIEDASGGGEPRILIAVEAGARARIDQVSIEFVGHVADAPAGAQRISALRAEWPLAPGEPFTQEAWDGAKRRLLNGLLAEDYAAADIRDSLAEVDAERATVNLRVVADSGPPFTLGEVEVSGLRTYDAELVSRYLRVEPGERYRLAKLLDGQAALQNSPYFSTAEIDVDRDAARPDRVPVRVRVAEARRHRLGFAVGFSSNTGQRAEVLYRQTALFGRPWYLTSGIRLERDRSAGYADVALPPRRSGYLDRFGVLVERSDIQGLDLRRFAAGAKRGRTRGRIETQWGLNFQTEEKRLDGAEAPETNNALTLDWTWTLRALDSLVDPRRGYVLSVGLGGASRALMSSTDFVRSHARLQFYLPVGDDDALIVRGEAGLTVAEDIGSVPQDFLFRAGGTQSVRGYAYNSLGVKQNDAVVGGRVLGTMSAEYVRWVTKQWGAAAFVDAGDAAENPGAFRPKLGYGVGGRWRSPAGPLALDLAYGHDERRVRLHFAVAIAF